MTDCVVIRLDVNGKITLGLGAMHGWAISKVDNVAYPESVRAALDRAEALLLAFVRERHALHSGPLGEIGRTLQAVLELATGAPPEKAPPDPTVARLSEHGKILQEIQDSIRRALLRMETLGNELTELGRAHDAAVAEHAARLRKLEARRKRAK